MRRLPAEIKLTNHARQRLEERKEPENYYNTKNLMKSLCKWYIKDDLIMDSALYKHCCYVCRKSNQLAYMTDGKLEVVYNKNTKVAVTVLEVKEKFLPITQFIKSDILKQTEKKKIDKRANREDDEIINIGDAILTYYNLYNSLIKEKLRKKEKQDVDKERKLEYNIVYRDKIKKPMTIKELYGIQ